MTPTPIRRLLLCLSLYPLMVLLSHPAAGQARRPPVVTDSAIAAGQQLFHGKGNCSACHGDAGVGTAEGPVLTTGRYRLGDGSYQWLLHITQHAAPGSRTREGDPAPMRGPTTLDSAETVAVAAYLWLLGHPTTRGP